MRVFLSAEYTKIKSRPALSAENMATQMNEKLAESVRNYPCLFDKRSADFKDKTKKAFAWSDVSKEVGLQNGK